MEVTMNTDLQDIGRALLAMCLISCSHIAQSAVTATHSVARITAYIVDEPHIQVPQQFNSDAAKSITAQAGLSIPQSLPSAIAFPTSRSTSITYTTKLLQSRHPQFARAKKGGHACSWHDHVDCDQWSVVMEDGQPGAGRRRR
jgi:hypothetical protein